MAYKEIRPNIAWLLAMVGFILIAWIHRERQDSRLRWNWFARHIGLIVCGLALSATVTRVAFATAWWRLAGLQLVGLLPIVLTLIPALSFYTIFRGRGWIGLAWTHAGIAVGSIVVATWMAVEMFPETGGMLDFRAFVLSPIAGVDYAAMFPLAARRLTRSPPFLPLAWLIVLVRLAYVALMLFTITRLTHELNRRRTEGDVAERTSASSGP